MCLINNYYLLYKSARFLVYYQLCTVLFCSVKFILLVLINNYSCQLILDILKSYSRDSHSVTTLATRILWTSPTDDFSVIDRHSTSNGNARQDVIFRCNKTKMNFVSERLDFYFEANNVTVPEKKRAIFLTVLLLTIY